MQRVIPIAASTTPTPIASMTSDAADLSRTRSRNRTSSGSKAATTRNFTAWITLIEEGPVAGSTAPVYSTEVHAFFPARRRFDVGLRADGLRYRSDTGLRRRG